jgi:hypothetical protein
LRELTQPGIVARSSSSGNPESRGLGAAEPTVFGGVDGDIGALDAARGGVDGDIGAVDAGRGTVEAGLGATDTAFGVTDGVAAGSPGGTLGEADLSMIDWDRMSPIWIHDVQSNARPQLIITPLAHTSALMRDGVGQRKRTNKNPRRYSKAAARRGLSEEMLMAGTSVIAD